MLTIYQQMLTKNAEKKIIIYHCEKCAFVCTKKSDYERHLLTRKHFCQHHPEYNNGKKYAILSVETPSKETRHNCKCGKTYKERTGLWKHKQKCTFIEPTEETTTNINNDLVIDLIKENKELKQMLIEQNNKILEFAKEGKHITNHTTNHFNLHVFLTEKCKDALNIMDFINSLELQLTDLEETAKLGYSEGISQIFIKGLKQLDVYKRPIHCSDLKREILYIKDKDQWEKEDNEKTKIKQAIKMVGGKNIKQIPLWVEQNPQCKDINSSKNDEYMKLISNSMIGSDEQETAENMNKIIKNVSKEVVIDKT